MFKKNLNYTSKLIRILLGLSLTAISLITFTPQHYLALYLLGLIGFVVLIEGILGWSPIFALTDRSDFPAHLNKFSKKRNARSPKIKN
jgi:hypothetical protein